MSKITENTEVKCLTSSDNFCLFCVVGDLTPNFLDDLCLQYCKMFYEIVRFCCIKLMFSVHCRLASVVVTHSLTTVPCCCSIARTPAWHGRWWKNLAIPLINVAQYTQMVASIMQVHMVNGDLLWYLWTHRWRPS